MQPITVPGKLDSLTAIRHYVEAAAAEHGLDTRKGYRLKLAIDEIATNAITYGYANVRDGNLLLHAWSDGDALVVVLEDSGPAFDPRTKEAPSNLDAPLEQRAIGGLGVFLAVTSVDEYRYQRFNGKNRNVFVMRRVAAGATPDATEDVT